MKLSKLFMVCLLATTASFVVAQQPDPNIKKPDAKKQKEKKPGADSSPPAGGSMPAGAQPNDPKKDPPKKAP